MLAADPPAALPAAEAATNKASGGGRPAGTATAAPAIRLAVTARSSVAVEAATNAVVVDCTIAGAEEDACSSPRWLMTRARANLPSPQHGAAPIALTVWPSSSSSSSPPHLEGAALARALSRAGTRNSFVCQQLAGMWSEQRAKSKAAGPLISGREHEEVFLATAALGRGEVEEGGEEEEAVAAAAIFYARPASADAACAPPHVYVELMVSSSPGKGIGGLLLRFVEAFAAANATRLGCAAQVRLLGVESAQPFYTRCGYGCGGDENNDNKYRRKEMVKELIGWRRGQVN